MDRGRRRRRGAARVHLSEASPLAVLDRIGSRGGEASMTASPTFRRTFRYANLQGYEDLIYSPSLFASPRLDLGFPLFASVENFDLLCRETLYCVLVIVVQDVERGVLVGELTPRQRPTPGGLLLGLLLQAEDALMLRL